MKQSNLYQVTRRGVMEVIDGCGLDSLRGGIEGLVAEVHDFLEAHVVDSATILGPTTSVASLRDKPVPTVVRRVYDKYGDDGCLVVSVVNAGMVCALLGWNRATRGDYPAALPPGSYGLEAQLVTINFCRLVAYTRWPLVREGYEVISGTGRGSIPAVALNTGLVVMFAETVALQQEERAASWN